MKNTYFASNGTAAMKAQEQPAFTVIDCRKQQSFIDDFDFAAFGFDDEKTFDYKPLTLEDARVSKRFFYGTVALGLLSFTALLFLFA